MQTNGARALTRLRWEYRLWVPLGDVEQQEAVLNEFGQEGWELVNLRSGGTLFFKRPAIGELGAERA